MKYFLKCLYNYANFSGRARRKEFWCFVFYSCLAIILCGILYAGSHTIYCRCNNVEQLSQYKSIFMSSFLMGISITSLFLTLPLLAVTIRRIHDFGNLLKILHLDKKHPFLTISIISRIEALFDPGMYVIVFFILIFYGISTLICMLLQMFFDINPEYTGIICTVLSVVFLMNIKGDPDDNKYGPNPRVNDPIDGTNKIKEKGFEDSEDDSSKENNYEPFAPRR